MKRTFSISVRWVAVLAAAAIGLGSSAAVADPGPAGLAVAPGAVEGSQTDPTESVVEWVGLESEEHLDSRYRWVTYYTSGTTWIWADPNHNHRRTFLRCGANKLNKIDSLRWHSGAERIYVTRDCLWNGKDGYSYTIKWQKRVLAGVV